MNKKQITLIIIIITVGLLLGGLIFRQSKPQPVDEHGHGEAAHGHEHAEQHGDAEHHGGSAGEGEGHAHADAHTDTEHHEDAPAKGAHGGKLFADGDFGLEIALDESSGEPLFKAYLYRKGQAIAPTGAKVGLTLTRPGGSKQEIGFTADKDALRSNQAIAEPHIFDATIAVQTASEPYLFAFSMAEGRLSLDEAQIKAAGITLQQAGPATLQSALRLPGEIRLNADRTAHVLPRVAGIVESVHADLGQQVKKGQLLAVVSSPALAELRSELLAAQQRQALAKSNHEREKQLWQEKISPERDFLQARTALQEADIALQNARQKLAAIGAASGGPLNRYQIRAPFDGMVVEKHLALGESLKEDSNIFTLSDLSSVWAEISVPAKDMARVSVGESVVVTASNFASPANGKVSYVGALIGEQNRAASARVVLPNPGLAWRPGLFVNIDLHTGEARVPVAVRSEAVQAVDGGQVVFVRINGGFAPVPVKTGRDNGQLVEITAGLTAGTTYAASGSFVLKSELGKGSAAHEH